MVIMGGLWELTVVDGWTSPVAVGARRSLSLEWEEEVGWIKEPQFRGKKRTTISPKLEGWNSKSWEASFSYTTIQFEMGSNSNSSCIQTIDIQLIHAQFYKPGRG